MLIMDKRSKMTYISSLPCRKNKWLEVSWEHDEKHDKNHGGNNSSLSCFFIYSHFYL